MRPTIKDEMLHYLGKDDIYFANKTNKNVGKNMGDKQDIYELGIYETVAFSVLEKDDEAIKAKKVLDDLCDEGIVSVRHLKSEFKTFSIYSLIK